MSWFDAAGLANIAKSALKEAQRTIDKALDIKDDIITDVSTPIDINNEDFFGSWVGHQTASKKGCQDKTDFTKQETLQKNIWGSFAGSFFEQHEETCLEGLEDSADFNSQQFTHSKLVVDQNDDNECTPLTGVSGNAISVNAISSHDEDISNYVSTVDKSKDATREYKDKTDNIHENKEDTRPSSTLKEPVVETAKFEISDGNPTSPVLSHICQNYDTELQNRCTKNESPSPIVLEEPKENFKSNEQQNDFITNIQDKNSLPNAITVPPSRNIAQLPLSNIDDDTIDIQPQCSKQEITDILRSTNVIDIPVDVDSMKSSSENPLEVSTDEGSQSDITIKGTDLQDICISENSREDDASYLKNLLADAISDKDSVSGKTFPNSESNSVHNDGMSSENLSIIQIEMPSREYSPLSSDKSDLVKVGSDHTSGHTSGDELETTTSSDIEIISSPNGDSSSTQSRHSPVKQTCRKNETEQCQVDGLLSKMTKNSRGHNRDSSQVSSFSDDSLSPEVEKLIKKITEMTEILESRESKIVDINRRNLELQELNMDLKSQLNTILVKQLESQDLTQVTEEYAQRMSALEKKFQKAIHEKDTLRKQLDQVKQEAALRLSKSELDSIVKEKDEMIKQLREEGEKLSKQQLQHSNIIKKLRTKEKENETAIKQLKDKVEDFTSETERLKRTVIAKEEVERSQIEAVNQLTLKNKKIEADLAKSQSELEDQIQKYETLKKSLDAARKELSDKNKITNQLSAKEQMLESMENEKKVAESQNEEVINQLQFLRMKLHEYECEYSLKERNLRQENTELLKRLENAESRNEELSQSVLEVSKPLVRQLESLQATHNLKMAHFEKVELELTTKINELQFRLKSSLNTEKISKEESAAIKSKLAGLEVDFSRIKHQKDLLELQLEQLKTEKTILQQELKGKDEELQSQLKTKCDTIEELSQELLTLKLSLKKVTEDMANIAAPPVHELEENIDDTNSNPRSTSPTLSVDKTSIADSLVSSVWSQIESFDIGHAPRYTNMFEIQMLQSNLQQREGELQQLQWELNRREQERNLLNSELTLLTSRVEELMTNLADYEGLKSKFEELQEQYDVLCQMYGEKVDEVEELKLDLLEAKEAYKSQLDELLRNQTTSSS